jgi:hypothetical protein
MTAFSYRYLGGAAGVLAAGLGAAACAQTTAGEATTPTAPVAARRPSDDADAIFGGSLPPGYRDWRVVSVAHEEGELNDLRAVLGNDVAITAYRAGTLPFPDGAIIARIAWKYVPSEDNNQAFGREQSHVAGPPANGVQFMVKDAKRFADTGGWGFAQFNDGKQVTDRVKLGGCFSCHEPFKQNDLVFTHYAP